MTSDELKYKYYVVYLFHNGNKSGTGSMDTSLRYKITDSEAVKSIKDFIENDQGFTDVVILSWLAYEKENWFARLKRIFK